MSSAVPMAPVMRYFRPASSERSRATSMAARMYSDTDSSSMPMNSTMRSPAVTVSIIPVAAASSSARYSGRRPVAAGSPHDSVMTASADSMMIHVSRMPMRLMWISPAKPSWGSPQKPVLTTSVATIARMPTHSGRRRARPFSGTTPSTMASRVAADMMKSGVPEA